nr:hypothetical protein [Candidatus Cloacimonadota bacterium]
MQYGLLVDLRTIQDYIFSSNRLKDNIGASYLVKHFFDLDEEGVSQEGFCGGGNFFRLCQDEDEAKQIIRKLSIKIYEQCPGLSFNACYIPDFDIKDYQNSMGRLQDKLFIEKNTRLQQTTLPAYGINAQCSASRLSAEIISDITSDQKDLLSRVVYSKRQASAKAVTESQSLYQEVLGENFLLPEEFSDLGQDKGNESFIAVVYIDGNQFGELFRKQNDFEQCKALSERINKACEQAFTDMLRKAVKEIRDGKWSHYKKKLSNKDSKFYLPIRPLLIGGDDITFISEGRLGLSLAIEFMENFSELLQDLDISSSAGIALAKTNYPFYQVHKLAQQLCSSAKAKRRSENSKLDFLDFHIISSSVSQDLEDLRKQNYVLSDGRKLYQRPYSLPDMKKMIENADSLSHNWPSSKIKELRSILYQPDEQIKAFEAQRQTRKDLTLPCEGMDSFSNTLFMGNETIFLDMIEIIEMLPEEDSQ